MLPSFARLSVELLTPIMTDDHGEQVPDWSKPHTSATVSGCSWQPSAGVTDGNHQQLTTAPGALYMPAGTDVSAHQRVKFRGKTYEILGEPMEWIVGVGRVDHVVINLVRREG